MQGIYIIKNLTNGKVYIGQSKDVSARLRRHKWNLRRGTHRNLYLQNAFCKHGEKAFSFGVVCECTEDELDSRERAWIEWFGSTNRKHGYNLETGGNALKTLSDETRRKIAETVKGTIRPPRSDEHRRNLSKSHKGHAVSDETRRKMSESHKGLTHSDQTRRKQSKSHKGHAVSDETRRKLSEATKLHYQRVFPSSSVGRSHDGD